MGVSPYDLPLLPASCSRLLHARRASAALARAPRPQTLRRPHLPPTLRLPPLPDASAAASEPKPRRAFSLKNIPHSSIVIPSEARFVIHHSSFVIQIGYSYSSFVIRHSSFLIPHAPFVILHSSFIIPPASALSDGLLCAAAAHHSRCDGRGCRA